jgi:hypothetical protein
MAAKKHPGSKLDDVVAAARRHSEQREKEYRERALKMYPWVCGRCGREFNRDNNPADGSNWELLCVYCHDNEHQRQLEAMGGPREEGSAGGATHNPFAGLKDLLKDDEG